MLQAPSEISMEASASGWKTWPRRVALALIRFYQRAISPLSPPACRFHPTCSHYTYEAVERFGVARGVLLGIMRLMKCHPLHRGGVDLVPQQFGCTLHWCKKVRPISGVNSDTSSQDDVSQ